MRAPSQSTRKPAGVCSAADTHVEGGEGKADLGVAHAIFGAHEGQQRRQQQDVIMRDEMRRADRPDDADSAARASAPRISVA